MSAQKQRIAETATRSSTAILSDARWHKLRLYWRITELRIDKGVLCLRPPPMASMNRSDGFVSAELPSIPNVTQLKVDVAEPVYVMGCDAEVSIISKETEKPILEIIRAADDVVAITSRFHIREEDGVRPVSSVTVLPQRLLVPAIVMPDQGIVYAPISNAGAMAIPAFDSENAAVTWLNGGGDALIWPIANQRQLPGGRIGIVETTPEKLRNGIPSVGGRKRVVHLNPRVGLSPDDQTVVL